MNTNLPLRIVIDKTRTNSWTQWRDLWIKRNEFMRLYSMMFFCLFEDYHEKPIIWMDMMISYNFERGKGPPLLGQVCGLWSSRKHARRLTFTQTFSFHKMGRVSCICTSESSILHFCHSKSPQKWIKPKKKNLNLSQPNNLVIETW